MEEVCPGWAASQHMETRQGRPSHRCLCGHLQASGLGGRPPRQVGLLLPQEAGARAGTTGVRTPAHLLTYSPSQPCLRLLTF